MLGSPHTIMVPHTKVFTKKVPGWDLHKGFPVQRFRISRALGWNLAHAEVSTQ